VSSNRRFQPLDLVGQLVRPLLAYVLDPGTVMAKRRIRHRRFQMRIVEPVDFQFEEQQRAGDVGDFFLRVAVKFGPRRVRGVAGIEQRGVGHQPTHQILQRFVGANDVEQFLAGVLALQQSGEPALVRGGENLGLVGATLHVGREFRRLRARIKILQSPLRQRAHIVRRTFRRNGARGGGEGASKSVHQDKISGSSAI